MTVSGTFPYLGFADMEQVGSWFGFNTKFAVNEPSPLTVAVVDELVGLATEIPPEALQP